MLAALLERYPLVSSEPRLLGVVGLSESDAQVRIERAISSIDKVGFTILARPGDVRVILTDKGCGRVGLDKAAEIGRARAGRALLRGRRVDPCRSRDSRGRVLADSPSHWPSRAPAEWWPRR